MPGPRVRHRDVGEDSDSLHCRLPSDPVELRPLRQALTGWAARTGLDPDQVQDLVLAVSEAVSNSIEHAYPPESSGQIWVDADVGVGEVRVVVTDHGDWRAPTTSLWRGRGVSLIHSLATHACVEHDEVATVVTMVWELPPGGGNPPAAG